MGRKENTEQEEEQTQQQGQVQVITLEELTQIKLDQINAKLDKILEN